MNKPDLMAELAEVVRSVAEYEAHERATPESCSDHEDAPHGFDRNGSHNEDRYVCECEHWEPDAATNVAIARKAIDFLRTHHAELEAVVRDASGEREESWEVWQDDEPVASSDSLANARHYLWMYGQDGPAKLIRMVTYREEVTQEQAAATHNSAREG